MIKGLNSSVSAGKEKIAIKKEGENHKVTAFQGFARCLLELWAQSFYFLQNALHDYNLLPAERII